MLFRRWRLLPAAVLLSSLCAANALGAPPSGTGGVVDGAVPLAFVARPRTDMPGKKVWRAAPARVPVVVQLGREATDADVAALKALGATGVERFVGAGGLRARWVLADVPQPALAGIAKLEGVERVSLDGPVFAPPRPLDYTAALVQASDVWRERGEDGLAIDGHGMTVCDIDSGVDPFHPLFFRADGNSGKPYFAWIDIDSDGVFDPGVDGVELFGDGAVFALRVLNSVTTHIWDEEPQFGTENPALDPGFDYLYADTNGSGVREYGRKAGFSDQSPTFGEQLFTVDDVNRNGVLDVGEKIVALGTSKVKSVRFENKVYRRGENLVDLPVNDDMAHGTGASGVLVGGTIGLTRLVGMAPGADLVMATNSDGTNEVKLAKFCHDEGARVVLHEYAPWVGYHLDGSSEMEKYIDETMALDTVHVNPAGNLSGSEKLYKNDIEAGATTDVPVEVPNGWGFGFLGLSFLWQDASRDLSFVLEDPTGFSLELDTSFGKPWHDGIGYYFTRETSDRGTVKIDVYLFSAQNPVELPTGTWKMHVTDPTPAGAPNLTLIGYAMDELSGWGKGIYFSEHQSEEHYIGYPGTADHGIPIAAYTGHGYWGAEPDVRAPYSGRGVRIDGTPILWISAPDDPITAGLRDGTPSLHIIYGGTSGASPHVAGTATLMLAQNPALTGDDVKEALRKGALADEAVLSAGPVPNTDYGHGKLRIFESIYGEPPPGGSPPAISIVDVTVEVGDTANVAITASDPDEATGALVVEVDRDYDGVFDEVVSGLTLSVPAAEIGTVVSKVRVTDGAGRSAAALAFVHVVEKGTLKDPEPEPEPGSEVVAAGGGGCSTAGERGSASAAWWLAVAAMMAMRAAITRRGRRRRARNTIC